MKGKGKSHRAAHYTYDEGIDEIWEWHHSYAFLSDEHRYEAPEVETPYTYEADEAEQYNNEEAETVVEAVELDAYAFIAVSVGEEALSDQIAPRNSSKHTHSLFMANEGARGRTRTGTRSILHICPYSTVERSSGTESTAEADQKRICFGVRLPGLGSPASSWRSSRKRTETDCASGFATAGVAFTTKDGPERIVEQVSTSQPKVIFVYYDY